MDFKVPSPEMERKRGKGGTSSGAASLLFASPSPEMMAEIRLTVYFKVPSPEMKPWKRRYQLWSCFLVICVTSSRIDARDKTVNFKVPSPDMEP